MEKYRPLQELGIDVNNGVIPLIGEIDENMFARLVMCLTALNNANIGYSELTILLNTPGGEVDQAYAIYDTLRNQSCKIRVVCNGPVQSAGTIILMAGDIREMTKNSSLMFHYGVDGVSCENDKKWSAKLDDKYKQLFKDCKTTPKVYKEWYSTNVYYDPDQALKLGLITGIIDNDKRKKRTKKSAN